MSTVADFYLHDRPTLLFSLHPEPTQAIIDGSKLLEYRRRFFSEPFQAFVYTSGPNGGIRLYLRCDKGLQLPPDQLALVGALIQHDSPAVGRCTGRGVADYGLHDAAEYSVGSIATAVQ